MLDDVNILIDKDKYIILSASSNIAEIDKIEDIYYTINGKEYSAYQRKDMDDE